MADHSPPQPCWETRYILYKDQQRYLDEGWELTPHIGPHRAYGVIASRRLPEPATGMDLS